MTAYTCGRCHALVSHGTGTGCPCCGHGAPTTVTISDHTARPEAGTNTSPGDIRWLLGEVKRLNAELVVQRAAAEQLRAEIMTGAPTLSDHEDRR